MQQDPILETRGEALGVELAGRATQGYGPPIARHLRVAFLVDQDSAGCSPGVRGATMVKARIDECAQELGLRVDGPPVVVGEAVGSRGGIFGFSQS